MAKLPDPIILAVPFTLSVPGLAQRTAQSNPISIPFMTLEYMVYFPQGANQLLQARFFVAWDKSTPTDKQPEGTNLFAQYGQIDYILGDNETRRIPNEVPVDQVPARLKLHATNLDTFTHTLNAIVIFTPFFMEH